MRYLGIDYGKTKMGLAISEGNLATPYKIIETRSLKDALSKILSLLKIEQIDKVVVGIPESGQAKNIALKFAQSLAQNTIVIEADETLSSDQAKNQMLISGKSKKSRKREDSFAAAIILQEFLDSESSYE